MSGIKGMLMVFLALVTRVCCASKSCQVNGKTYTPKEIMTRDYTIIGGGSSGTYSAIRLGDLGYSTLVIEKIGRLGGNTETYIDPITNSPIDYSVLVWHKFDVVYNYFARLNVSLSIADLSTPGVSVNYVDFQTGVVNTSYTTPDFTAALGAYAEQLALYPYLDFGFNLTYPVPADLLLPFGEFATKYELESLIPFMWLFAQGVGNILDVSTIYIMKYLGLSSVADFATGFLSTTAHDNSLLYEAAQEVLDKNVFYNSTVLDLERTADGVSIIVQTPTGIVLVESKRLIVAIQPLLDNLQGFDLSEEEKTLFGQFAGNEYFTGIIRNSGIPDDIQLTNYDPNQPYGVPLAPSLYSLVSSGVPNLHKVTYLSTTTTANGEIAGRILEGLAQVQLANKTDSTPEWAAQSIHRPFELQVPAAAIADGFYRDLYDLQGERNTFYVSATFHAHDSSLIWRFIEDLLPTITA